jgi:hypothetical protein
MLRTTWRSEDTGDHRHPPDWRIGTGLGNARFGTRKRKS